MNDTAVPDSAAAGLASAEAARRLATDGPNEIARARAKPAWKVLFAQFQSALVLLLLVACVLSAVLGETADAIAIAVIVVINAGVGFAQEYKAERALFALRALTAPHARVIRDGHVLDLAAREVVVGTCSPSRRETSSRRTRV